MQREQMFDTYRAALAKVAASKRARQRIADAASFRVRARLIRAAVPAMQLMPSLTSSACVEGP